MSKSGKFKKYQTILGFIIFSLNKSLKMPIAKLKEKFEHILLLNLFLNIHCLIRNISHGELPLNCPQ